MATRSRARHRRGPTRSRQRGVTWERGRSARRHRSRAHLSIDQFGDPLGRAPAPRRGARDHGRVASPSRAQQAAHGRARDVFVDRRAPPFDSAVVRRRLTRQSRRPVARPALQLRSRLRQVALRLPRVLLDGYRQGERASSRVRRAVWERSARSAVAAFWGFRSGSARVTCARARPFRTLRAHAGGRAGHRRVGFGDVCRARRDLRLAFTVGHGNYRHARRARGPCRPQIFAPRWLHSFSSTSWCCAFGCVRPRARGGLHAEGVWARLWIRALTRAPFRTLSEQLVHFIWRRVPVATCCCRASRHEQATLAGGPTHGSVAARIHSAESRVPCADADGTAHPGADR